MLGVDFGERRIGLALSHPTGTIASPLTTLTRRAGKRPAYRTPRQQASNPGRRYFASRNQWVPRSGGSATV